jgi:hypothetical protein
MRAIGHFDGPWQTKNRVDRRPSADSRRIPAVFRSHSRGIPVGFRSHSRCIPVALETMRPLGLGAILGGWISSSLILYISLYNQTEPIKLPYPPLLPQACPSRGRRTVGGSPNMASFPRQTQSERFPSREPIPMRSGMARAEESRKRPRRSREKAETRLDRPPLPAALLIKHS